MFGSEHYMRLAAALVAAGLLGAMIVNPGAGKRYAQKAAALNPDATPVSARACEQGVPALRAPFAPMGDILSVSPLGEATAPGEQLPAPAIRLNTKKGRNVFERRVTSALAPARIY